MTMESNDYLRSAEIIVIKQCESPVIKDCHETHESLFSTQPLTRTLMYV